MSPEMFWKKGGFDKMHQKAESHVHNEASVIDPPGPNIMAKCLNFQKQTVKSVCNCSL